MVASLLHGQFAWQPLYDGQLSCGQFVAVSCRVLARFQQLDPSTTCGPENIPNKFYILIDPMIAPYLADIFNSCFENGNYPLILKYAKLIPVHKGGRKDITNNYGPISIISISIKSLTGMVT